MSAVPLFICTLGINKGEMKICNNVSLQQKAKELVQTCRTHLMDENAKPQESEGASIF